MSAELKVFYKYKKIDEFALDSLRNKYFYFSTPNQLNDPEDCRLRITDNLEKYNQKDFDRLRMALIKKVIKEKRLNFFDLKNRLNY